jgi:hypothetical protein
MDLGSLVSTLASSLEAGVPVFVLVDPLLGEPLPIDPGSGGGDMQSILMARREAWSRDVQFIELASSIDLPAHLHPYLVELNGSQDPWLGATVEMAISELLATHADGLTGTGTSAHRIGGWIQSNKYLPLVARSLSEMMKVSTLAFTKARYQRLADRRVLDWLRLVVGDTRVAGQFLAVTSWSYLNPCGQLATLRGAPDSSSGLRLDPAEWAAFVRGDLLHQITARWLGEQSKQGLEVQGDSMACYRKANAALDAAEAAARTWPQRFASTADTTAWGALSLLHPGFEKCPDVIALMSAPRSADEPLETVDSMCSTINAMLQKATP